MLAGAAVPARVVGVREPRVGAGGEGDVEDLLVVPGGRGGGRDGTQRREGGEEAGEQEDVTADGHDEDPVET